MDALLLIDLVKAHDKAIYWKQRCELAEVAMLINPEEDLDYALQVKACSEYLEFIRTHPKP